MLNTRRRVLIIDQLATALITVIGLSVILAVAGMMVFLISSSWPLFKTEKFVSAGRIELPHSSSGMIVDEIAPLAVLLPKTSETCLIKASLIQQNDPEIQNNKADFSYQLARSAGQTPESLNPWSLVASAAKTNANSPSETNNAISCGGSKHGNLIVRSGNSLASVSVQIVREFLSPEETKALAPESRKELAEKKWILTSDNTVLVKASAQSPIAKLDLQVTEDWIVSDYFSHHSDSSLYGVEYIQRPGKKDGLIVSRTARPDNIIESQLFLLSSNENNLTGEKKTELREIKLPEPAASFEEFEKFQPAWIEGRYLVVPLQSKTFASIDTEDANLKYSILNVPTHLGSLTQWSPAFGGAAALAEFSIPLNNPPASRCAYLDVGRATRIASNSVGEKAEMGVLWQDKCKPALKNIAHPHKRILFRVVQGGSADSLLVEARELTTGRIAAQMNTPTTSLDSLKTDTHGNLISWLDVSQRFSEIREFIAPHVEVSLKSLFEKIHYESYENASYSWQSTSGTDEFQSKFSLIPLIWGTFKATLYSLLFAVPLAIFAAVYSSEILDRQTRNVVKPTLEMMASVPSVVLGFLAAIVVAPWIESHIVSVLLIGTSMPFLLYVFGVFLQVPSARHLTTRGLYASRRLLLWVIVGFAVMLWLLSRAGLLIERTAFGGDLKAFLSGGPGTEGVLWGLLLLPLVFITLWSLPIRRARNWYKIAIFVLGPVIAVGIGALISGHTELRADLLGQYAQRNTLVIAIAMGFAIIPIIYSLAEDALTSVPNSLRAGSLACGASVWQTTARVVLPTAASGLFSAIMVGLGRGIGETMIAVMATGNTAVMTTNPFDGLRSMAANIAVELPEAAQGSTHYRILFLSALTLFMFTFTLNSFAEFLRARYRARNKAL